MPKSKPYKIYALIYQRTVYIGKTFSRLVSSVYHRHCRGELKATQRFNQNGEKPELHILHCGDVQAYEAYQCTLAYIKFFKEEGYQILNCQRSIDRAEALHPAPQALFETLQTEGLDKILTRSWLKNPTDADWTLSVPCKEVKEKKEHKITIRLNKAERDYFMQACADLELDQRKTLLYMLAKACEANATLRESKENVPLLLLINDFRNEIARLTKRNDALKEKLEKVQFESKNKLQQKEMWIKTLKTVIEKYFEMLESVCKIPVGFEIGNYDDFLQAKHYKYPEEQGWFVFRPQEVLRGNGRWGPLFILGKGDEEALYKFRWYPKEDFVGPPIWNYRKFGKRGSVWLVACEKAKDGSMDLMCSFPLDVGFRYNGPEEYGSEFKRFMVDLEKEIEQYDD